MTSTTAKMSRLGLTLPIACLGLALGFAGTTRAQQDPSTAGCAQKSDQDQYSSGSHMAAQQADQEQAAGPSYKAQKTAGGGGMPQSLIAQSQPQPRFSGQDTQTASNNRATTGRMTRPCG